MSLDHMVSVPTLGAFLWLILTMLNDIRVLFNPLSPIQEKISIAKTWATFLSIVGKLDRTLSLSNLDYLDDEK